MGERARQKAKRQRVNKGRVVFQLPTGVGRGGRVGLAVLHGGGGRVRRVHGRLGGVQVGLLLELADVLLVPDPLVAEPVGYLHEAERNRGGGCGEGEEGEGGGGAEESDVKQPHAPCTHRAV